jgi:MFS transporter, DHA2 family, multidrug resistance protein
MTEAMAAPAQSGSRRWWALAALALSVLVVGLDLFVLTLAIPTLSVDLHATSSDAQWFLDAYTLVLAAALLPAGLLGDRYGRKRLLMWSLVLFGISSLACAYSVTSSELIAARAALGLAAAVITPLSLAVLPVMFAPEERPRAIAIVGGATFIGLPLGPILGGWLLDNFWWGSVFLINVPIVIIAIIVVAFLMPESRSGQRPRIDVAGVLISSAGLALVTYGLIKAGQLGWSNATAISTMAAGVVVLGGFVAWERHVSRRGQPLVDLSLFGSAGFTWGTLLSTMVSFALFGITFAMPQYFLDVRGLNSLSSGVRMLALIGGLIVGLGVGQRLQSVRKAAPGELPRGPIAGPKVIGATGFAIMAVALAIGTATTSTSGAGILAAWFAITGLGLGLAMPTMLNAALAAFTVERSGSASALMTAARQVGATIGVAVLGTVIATVYRSQLHLAGLSASTAALVRSSVAAGVAVAKASGSAPLLDMVRQSYTSGVDTMLWVCAGIAIAAAILAALFIPKNAGGPAVPAADDSAHDQLASVPDLPADETGAQ